MVNLNFRLGHCFDYCTTKINILRFSILQEIEINFFYFFIQLCFCTCKLQKNVMQSNFPISDIPNPIAVYCFPYQFIYFVAKTFWRASSYIPYVFNSLKKCLNLVYVFPVFPLSTLCWLCSFFL